MKLLKVKYKNHPVLGSLELDFVNPDTGLPYQTIILLGENGTGKTTILSTISNYLNCVSLDPFEYIEYEADGKKFHIQHEDGNTCFHKRTNIATGDITNIRRDKSNSAPTMYADKEDARSYSTVFSKARADFKTSAIKSSTTKTLDSERFETDHEDNYTSLKQLLVDISEQDNQKFVEYNKATNKNYDDFEPISKLYRFKHAFNNFFTNIQFGRVADINGEKVITFKKNGHEIMIDQLSTGEKQVVYRGAYLLKNSGNMDEGTVFIDEPELSMHPAWQRRILSYFMNLYKDDSTGKQKAQMFFASHSDAVVIDALKDMTNNLVVVLTESGGAINAKRVTAPIVLPTITNAELNYWAFGIYSTDFHIALYGYLQTLTGHNSIVDCDNYIESKAPIYDASIHQKITFHPNGSTTYKTICSAIRNHIDHPDNGYSYTEEELQRSTELLIELINDWKVAHP